MWFKCNNIMRCFCGLGATTASLWSPEASSPHSCAQTLVFVRVNSLNLTNRNFDDTLNALHPMVFLAEKENNKTYTFSQMLTHQDAAELVKAMIKEANNHESWEHWRVVPRWGENFRAASPYKAAEGEKCLLLA